MDKIHSVNSDVPIISVIAPVYKVEPFLQECIDSVLNQSFKDFELILVDDGSPDKCGEICDIATMKDSRIRVVHQENRGLSGARKSGLENAIGEWICIVDPDDNLPPDALNDLITACNTLGYNIEDFDVIEGNSMYFYKNERTGKEIYSRNGKDGNIVTDAFGYAKEVVFVNAIFRTQTWAKIMRRSVLVDTKAYDVSRDFFQGQDVISNLKMAKNIRKALKIQKIVYNYRLNPKGTAMGKMAKYLNYSYTSFWWNGIKEVLQNMPGKWQDLYKIFVAKTFWWRFSGEKGRTWKLRSAECKPYIDILYEKKAILPITTKICLLVMRFPFTLIPEKLFFTILFSVKFIVMVPVYAARKLKLMISQ